MSIDFTRNIGETAQSTESVDILRVRAASDDSKAERRSRDDRVAVEEPLEIRLGHTFLGEPVRRSISVTMRTPGDDHDLAVGFLFGEGVVSTGRDIKTIEFCDGDDNTGAAPTNIIRVVVVDDVDVDMASVQRNFYTTSSCGVCGKASLEALEVQDCPTLDTADLTVDADLIYELPDRLRDAQPLFAETGGIHAAGLFDGQGELIALREDVGRHNALDKLVGSRLRADRLPLSQSIIVLSGRASFELLQKALMARAPVVVAVGAPSSLAVDLAVEFGITLIGFTRDDRFNVYSHADRIS